MPRKRVAESATCFYLFANRRFTMRFILGATLGLLHTRQPATANRYSHCTCGRLFHSAAGNRPITTFVGCLAQTTLTTSTTTVRQPCILEAQAEQITEL